MDLPPCEPGSHAFRYSDDTNEPIGRCIRCERSLDWVEAQAESQEPQAFADVAPEDTEAYLAALDAEAVRESR